MRIILVTLLFLLAGNVWAENPVDLSSVTLEYQTVFASAALIVTGFGLALVSFWMGIQYMKWLRDAGAPYVPKSEPKTPP